MTISRNGIFFFLTVIAAIVFYFFRSNTFDLPFFWDEAWVYGPAVKSMGKHWCFLPSCAGELSRGHPLLFHFLGGTWIKLFGDTQYSLHFFAFSITVILFFSCYYVGLKFYGAIEGFLFCILVIVQNLIFGQSAMLYPEILLTLFALWTLYFYVTNNRYGFALFGFLMCLVKEQGLVIVGAFFLWEILSCSFRSSFRYFFSPHFFSALSSFLIQISGILIFLLIQKFQKGYWFFPEHIHLIKTDLKNVFYHFKLSSFHLFVANGRYVLLAIILIIVVFLEKKWTLSVRILVMSGIIMVFFLLSGFFRLHYLIVTCLTLSFIMLFRFFFNSDIKNLFSARSGLFSVIILSYLIFCSFNFFTLRYLAVLVPFFILLTFDFLCFRINNHRHRSIIFSFSFLSSLLFLIFDYSYGDVSPRNYQAILSQKEVVDRLIALNANHESVYSSFVMRNNLNHASSGFVTKDNFFSRCTNYLQSDSAAPKYLIHFNFEQDSAVSSFLKFNKHRYQPIFLAEHGRAQGIIYQIK